MYSQLIFIPHKAMYGNIVMILIKSKNISTKWVIIYSIHLGITYCAYNVKSFPPLAISLSVRLSICLCPCLSSVCLSLCLSAFLFVCLSLTLCLSLSVYLSVGLSFYQSIFQPLSLLCFIIVENQRPSKFLYNHLTNFLTSIQILLNHFICTFSPKN